MRNLLLLVITIGVCSLIGEVALRTLTPFPTGHHKKTYDARAGYRLSPDSADVDRHGFRNPAGRRANAAVGAIGDSHTYGVNVFAAAAWPAQFGEMTGQATYNFGVSSYNVYTYHPLVMDALAAGKRVIVGLYPANDFAPNFSQLQGRAFHGDYWKSQVQRHDLELLGLPPSHFDRPDAPKAGGWKQWLKNALKNNVAILSALDYFVWDYVKRFRLEDLLGGGDSATARDVYTLGDGLRRIETSRLAKTARVTDLTRAAPARVYRDFRRLAAAWREAAEPGQLGFLVLASQAQVYAQWLRIHGSQSDIPSGFMADVAPQDALTERVMRFAEQANIPAVTSMDQMLGALERARANDAHIYPRRGTHPLRPGYTAYAKAARRLDARLRGRAQGGDGG